MDLYSVKTTDECSTIVASLVATSELDLSTAGERKPWEVQRRVLAFADTAS
jgi:hypothetical protein